MDDAEQHSETIAAIATPLGEGAIGIVRLSGPDAVGVADVSFARRRLAEVPSHTLGLRQGGRCEGEDPRRRLGRRDAVTSDVHG